MIIRHIRLHPFAGIPDRDVELKPGLNVILGPNEAGKSTLVHALRTVLFACTEYGQREWNAGLKRFVPLGGGDTFRVSLGFQVDGSAYCLAKSWGHDRRSELTLPGGQVVAAPDEVQSQIEALLGLRRGTWENVLFAYQAHLPGTIEKLRGNSPEANDLAQLLRKAVFATDGVSIEKLGKMIESQLEAATLRWDARLQRPEGNRGIDNPWKRGTGTVLEAWYTLERIRQERERTDDFERRLDALTARINEVSIDRNQLHEYVETREQIVADVEDRRHLEFQLKASQEKEKKLKEILGQWPRLEGRKKDVLASEATKGKRQKELEAELAQAKAFEATRAKRYQLFLARKKASEIETPRRALKEKRQITDDQLKELTALDAQRQRLEAGLSAGQLKLTIETTVPLHVGVQKDFEEESDRDITPAAPLSLQAGGRIALSHPDWKMEVESGEMSFEQLQSEHHKAVGAFDELLKALDIESLEKVRKLHEDSRLAAQAVERLDTELAVILDGTTIEALTEEVGLEVEGTPPRGLDVIGAAKAEVEIALEACKKKIAEIEEQVTAWSEEYESWDNLQDCVLDVRAAAKDIDQKIAKLQPLPDDVTDPDAFLAEFKGKQQRLRIIKEEELPQLKIDRAELEKETPERSLQELDEALRDAEQEFERREREAAALKRVQKVYRQLREELDSGTLEPWVKRLRTVVEPLTGGRYEEVNLDTSEASRSASLNIPYELLSVGTQTCLGLAVRLSMASHFLEGRSGFLLLDDPLVDLDPERQAATAGILKGFAEDKQVIVFTCHPRHAELMGAEPIEVERTA